MSFSATVKSELCRTPLNRPCCAKAEAYGVLLYANCFSAREIRIITASPALAQRLPKLWKRAFSLSFDAVSSGGRGGKTVFRYTEQGIDTISMRDDFATIYGEGVKKGMDAADR